jgi:hypothetical protein
LLDGHVHIAGRNADRNSSPNDHQESGNLSGLDVTSYRSSGEHQSRYERECALYPDELLRQRGRAGSFL